MMLRTYYIYSGFIMGSALAGLGVFMLIKPPIDHGISQSQIYFFGVTAILYGGFRFWRSVKAYKEDKAKQISGESPFDN